MSSEQFINHYEQRISNNGQLLVRNFFIAFSRFESALKATIIFANGDERKVEPNWERFVATIRETFDKNKNKEIGLATKYLLKHPPKIQTLVDGQISWRVREFQDNTPEINKLCLHIRDVRNNLFHGGKFSGTFEKDVSRNYKLIKSAMIILDEWLELQEDVKHKFLREIS